MQFVVIGLDGEDSAAPARRQAHRQRHIEMGEKLSAEKKLWYGAALLHDDGSMKGSIYILNFSSRNELDEYLKTEPYIFGDVWGSVTIHASNTRDPWQFRHDKEWFDVE